MKKLTVLLFVLFNSVFAFSQELKWETDLNKAIEVSNKTNKPMLLFFTGSDWCGWCIRLQNEVLKKPEFAAWATENVVLVEVDFPKRTPQSQELKVQNNDLQQAFGIQGYPTIWITNASYIDGKLNFDQLGKTGYVAGGTTAWLSGANDILKNNKKAKTVEAKPAAVEKIQKKQLRKKKKSA